MNKSTSCYRGALIISNPDIRQSPRTGVPIEGYYHALLGRLREALALASANDLRPVIVGEFLSGPISHEAMSALIEVLIGNDCLWIPRKGELSEGHLKDKSAVRVLESARIISVAKMPHDAVVNIVEEDGAVAKAMLCIGSASPWLLGAQMDQHLSANTEVMLGIVMPDGSLSAPERDIAKQSLAGIGKQPILFTSLDSNDHRALAPLNAPAASAVAMIKCGGELEVRSLAAGYNGIVHYAEVSADEAENEFESEFASLMLGTNGGESLPEKSSESEIMEKTFVELGLDEDTRGLIYNLFHRSNAMLAESMV